MKQQAGGKRDWREEEITGDETPQGGGAREVILNEVTTTSTAYDDKGR